MAEVKFKFLGDDTELRKKLAEIARIQSTMNEQFSKSMGSAGNDVLSKSIQQIGKDAINAAKEVDYLNKTAIDSKLKEAKLAEIESIKKLREERSKEISDLSTLKQIEQEAKALLAEKKVITESLIQAERAKRVETQQGASDLNKYNLELKKASEERRKATEEERKAEKVLRETEKARKDAEREAAKQAKEAEKRKKQLEQESSEYNKLNKALYAVRKETKDVLAEMFRMERQGHKNTAGYEALRKKAEGLTKQTQYLDQGIKKIDATLGLHQRNVGNYGQALEAISPQFASINQKLQVFGTSIDELASKPGAIRELGAAFMSTGKAILSFLVSPVGIAISLITGLFMLFKGNKQTVIDFDSGLLNVSKTTGIAGAELQVLSDSIIQLSRSLKTVSTDKILEYATIAGQLGVKGPANIMAFSEALAKLETASDISGEEGGKGIARLLTLVDGGVQNVKSFGDEIVNLGNNFAASEKEILGNAEAISQNVGLYKVGRQDVLAYATATKALGMEAEVVGSTFQKTLGIFEKAIRSGKGVDSILKVVGGTRADLQKNFSDDASGVFQSYIKGLNGIYKAGGSVQAQMEQNGIVDIRQKRIIGTLATGYETLARAIDTAKDSAGAMDAEFETAAGKLENQSKRIGIAWDNMVLSIENGSGAIGIASVAAIGFFADILESVTKVVTSDSWTEFFMRLGPGTLVNSKSTDAFADAIKIGNQSPNDKKRGFTGYEDMKDFLRAGVEEQKRFLEVQEQVVQLRSKDYQSDKSVKRLEELNFQAEKLAKMRAKLATPVEGLKPGGAVPDDGESDKDRLKREKAEAAAARKAEQLAEQGRQAQERQRALQLSIDAINEQSLRKNLSKDAQEIASIKDKYNKIREEIRKFNADPKNKGQQVDASGLVKSERFETSEATTRQDTVKLAKDLNDQKALHDRFNSYLEATSKEEAEKRYAGQIELAKGYKANLLKEYADIVALQVSAAAGGFTGANGGLTQAQEERAKLLKELIEAYDNEAKTKEDAKYIAALNSAKSHSQKLIDIQKEYNDAVNALGESATEEQLSVLKKNRDEKISAEVSTNLQITTDWANTMETIVFLSRRAAKEMLESREKTLKSELAAGRLTRAEYNKLMDDLGQARGVVADKNIFAGALDSIKRYREQVKALGKDSLEAKKAQKEMFGTVSAALEDSALIGNDLSQSFETLGIGSEGFRESLGKSLKVLGDVGELGKAIATGNPVAIISASIKTLTSVIDLFNTKDKKLQKQIDNYKSQLDSLSKAYSQLENQISNSVGESYYSDSNKAIANLKEQQSSIEKMRKAEEDKKKSDKNKISDYNNQIDEANKKIKDLEKSITETLVQTSFKELSNSLAGALLSAFEAGENGINAMNSTFEDFIKKAVVNSLKLKILEPIINDMVGKVADYMKGNDNSLTGFKFDSWKDKLGDASEDFTKALDAAYSGLGLTKDKDKQGELSKGIAGITENAANRLESEIGGLRLANLELLELTKTQGFTLGQQLSVSNSMLNELVAINNNTYRTANNTDRLVGIETAIVSLNNKVGNNDAARRAGGL